MITRKLAALVAVLGLVASGCGRSSGDDSQPAAPSVDPFSIADRDGLVVKGLTAELDLQLTGAVEASYQGPAAMQLTTQVGANIPESAWMMLMGLLDPVTTASGWEVRTAFDLVGYRGDDTYTIRPRGGGDVEPLERDEDGNPLASQIGGAVESAAIVVLANDTSSPTSYGDLLEPCTLEVSDVGERGGVTCPRIAGPGGEMALSWSWAVTGVLHQLEEGQDGSPVPVEPDAVDGGATPPAPPGTGPDGSPEPAPEPEPLAPMDVAIDMSSTCWQRGVEVVVTITTEPQAALAMLVAYSDARTYGQHRLGTADAEGRFIWRVIPATDAPDGEGHFLVSAGSSDGKRGGTDQQEFQLETLCDNPAGIG